MNKELKIGIGVAVLILVGVLVANYFVKDNPNIITEKQVNLTAEQRKVYEDRLAQSEKFFSEAKDDEERHEVYLFIGHQKYGLGKLAEAEEAYRKSNDYKDDDFNSYTALYQVYLDMNDNNKARESIKKAIELRPDVADNWLKSIVLEKERFGASVDTQNKMYLDAIVATKDGSDFDVIAAYARFLEESGNLPAAKQQWQNAIAKNPVKQKDYEAEIKRIDESINQLP